MKIPMVFLGFPVKLLANFIKKKGNTQNTNPETQKQLLDIITKYKECNELVEQMITKALEDPDYLLPARYIWSAITLPVEIGLETNQKKKTHYCEFISGGCFERSKYMASLMHAVAKKQGYKRVHAIVGFAHESEIAYALKTRNLEDPKLRFQRNVRTRIARSLNPIEFYARTPLLAAITTGYLIHSASGTTELIGSGILTYYISVLLNLTNQCIYDRLSIRKASKAKPTLDLI